MKIPIPAAGAFPSLGPCSACECSRTTARGLLDTFSAGDPILPHLSYGLGRGKLTKEVHRLKLGASRLARASSTPACMAAAWNRRFPSSPARVRRGRMTVPRQSERSRCVATGRARPRSPANRAGSHGHRSSTGVGLDARYSRRPSLVTRRPRHILMLRRSRCRRSAGGKRRLSSCRPMCRTRAREAGGSESNRADDDTRRNGMLAQSNEVDRTGRRPSGRRKAAALLVGVSAQRSSPHAAAVPAAVPRRGPLQDTLTVALPGWTPQSFDLPRTARARSSSWPTSR